MYDTDFVIKRRVFKYHGNHYHYMIWRPQNGYHNAGWAMWQWDANPRYWRKIDGQSPCGCNPRIQIADALRQLRQ
jgi:hypothetical protein